MQNLLLRLTQTTQKIDDGLQARCWDATSQEPLLGSLVCRANVAVLGRGRQGSFLMRVMGEIETLRHGLEISLPGLQPRRGKSPQRDKLMPSHA